MFFSKIKPLSDREKYHLLEHSMIAEKVSSMMPNGFDYIKGQSEEGFLKLEYLDIFDYLPKENLELFEKEMNNFVAKKKRDFCKFCFSHFLQNHALFLSIFDKFIF